MGVGGWRLVAAGGEDGMVEARTIQRWHQLARLLDSRLDVSAPRALFQMAEDILD